jgi:hypothetical protein
MVDVNNRSWPGEGWLQAKVELSARNGAAAFSTKGTSCGLSKARPHWQGSFASDEHLRNQFQMGRSGAAKVRPQWHRRSSKQANANGMVGLHGTRRIDQMQWDLTVAKSTPAAKKRTSSHKKLTRLRSTSPLQHVGQGHMLTLDADNNISMAL